MELTTDFAELLAAGVAHHQAGRFGEATDHYSRVLASRPQCGDAWRLLGVVALQTGDNKAARELLERAIRIDPADATAQSALGGVGESEGRLDLAYTAYASACATDATQQAAVIGLTRVALALGKVGEAIAIAESAIARGMIDAGLLRSLGAARANLRDFAAAAEAFLASLRIQPHADAYANLAIAYMRLKRPDEAIIACESALALNPHHDAAANSLGCARAARAEFPAAFAALEHAIELGSEEAHINLGTGRLLLGEYHAGWPHYGWVSPERRANPAFAALPMWDGTPSPGRRLLIWPEQGVGDTIHMTRFLSRARALVGSVTLACPPGTIELFRTLEGVDTLIDVREPAKLDAFDFWLPTLRLPVVFDIAFDAIPAAPYLRADPDRVERFQSRLEAPGQLRVGLVWAGNPNHEGDNIRSCALNEFESLREIPGVTWFALQQGAGSEQMASTALPLTPINASVTDFADTAAIITQLDLVITVDTSVAHLAGALGRPAWVLISKRPDWRWQRSGAISPWYPTLRLFRQGDDGTWAPVVDEIGAALRDFCRSHDVAISTSNATALDLVCKATPA